MPAMPKSIFGRRFLERPAGFDVFNRSLQLLLVEDNRADVRLVQTALSQWTIPYQLHVTGNAETALCFIGRLNNYEYVPRPDLVLLDLSLERIPGFVVLTTIKENADLREIPVVILSNSGAENDIRAAYDLQADAYLTKGRDLKEHMRLFRRIESVWLEGFRMPFDGSDSPDDSEAGNYTLRAVAGRGARPE
jgi:chemotaxis family two-component system response regulator Rcp1